MKKYFSVIFLISAILLTGCNSAKTGNDLPETEENEIQLIDEFEENPSETVSEKERDDIKNAENYDNDNENAKGENDFYIFVTDRNGEEKAIYYIERGEGKLPLIYMEEIDDNPDIMFKYRSIISCAAPAKNGKAFFGEKLKEFAEFSLFDGVYFTYSINEKTSASRSIKNSGDTEKRCSELIEKIAEFEPEFVQGIEDGEINSYGSYDLRYPIRNIFIENSDNNELIDCQYPSISFVFSSYNGRTVGRLSIYDYSDILKLAKQETPISPQALEEAYYKSEYCASDWFYADNAEFYDHALKCIILNDDNALYNVKQERNLSSYSSHGGFSDNIAERINTDAAALYGYQDVQFGDFYFKLPADNKPIITEKMLLQTTGSDKKTVVKISKTDILVEGSDTSELWYAYYNGATSGTYGDYTLYDYAKGTFNGEDCQYISYRNNVTENFYYSVVVEGIDGYHCVVSCSMKADESTEEFTELAKNVFGSISLFASDEKIPEAVIKLSETPSIYSDECYEIADGMPSYGTKTEYKAFCPGVVEASFYAIDFTKKYDIGFECYLEKQEANGLWYGVEPIGEIKQENNGSGHFYNVFEEGRKNVSFDLAAYPLLPAGKYRLAMPFWDEGGADRNQYAAFYEFTVDEKTKTGDEIVGTASCEKEEYTADVREIKYSVEIDGGVYSVSSIADIERLENSDWVSVRKGGVKTNSIGGSYAMRFSGSEETIDTSGFDIFEGGEYRIRISVGEIDMERSNMFVNNYDTKYAYFKIV